MTAEAALPGPGIPAGTTRRTLTKVGIGGLAVGVLLLGGLALHATASPDDDATMTVAELDATLGITAAGSRELDRVPDAVQQSALDRESGDWAALQATGLPGGSAQRIGVSFAAAGRPAADRLAALLSRETDFTVAVSAPAGGGSWVVGGITPRAPLTVAVAHQLTERMTEAAWSAQGARFEGWRVVSR